MLPRTLLLRSAPLSRSLLLATHQQQRCSSALAAVTTRLPGVVASVAVMQAGFTAADWLSPLLLSSAGSAAAAASAGPSVVSGIPVAIVLGMLLGNSPWGLPKSLDPGLKFAQTTLLRAGIICVGAKLSATEVLAVGLQGVPAVVATVAVSATLLPWLGRKAGLAPKLSSVITIGTTICGVTAISALAPAIQASQKQMSFAIANVVAFGTVNMLLMPHFAHWMFTSSEQVGLFLGLAVHDTAQVVASALTYKTMFNDELAMQIALVTKLTRNLFLAIALPAFVALNVRAEQQALRATSASVPKTESGSRQMPGLDHSPSGAPQSQAALNLVGGQTKTTTSWTTFLPPFVLGFVGMAALRSYGDYLIADTGSVLAVLDRSQWQQLMGFIGNDLGSHWLLGTAMAAVGMRTSLASLRETGVRPFALGLVAAATVSGAGCACALALPHVSHLLG